MAREHAQLRMRPRTAQPAADAGRPNANTHTNTNPNPNPDTNTNTRPNPNPTLAQVFARILLARVSANHLRPTVIRLRLRVRVRVSVSVRVRIRVTLLDVCEGVACRRVSRPLQELLLENLGRLSALDRLLDLVLGRLRLNDPQLQPLGLGLGFRG